MPSFRGRLVWHSQKPIERNHLADVVLLPQLNNEVLNGLVHEAGDTTPEAALAAANVSISAAIAGGAFRNQPPMFHNDVAMALEEMGLGQVPEDLDQVMVALQDNPAVQRGNGSAFGRFARSLAMSPHLKMLVLVLIMCYLWLPRMKLLSWALESMHVEL